METQNQKTAQKPTSIRLSDEGQKALVTLAKDMREKLPSGVKLTMAEVIENAIIEQAKLVEQADQPK